MPLAGQARNKMRTQALKRRVKLGKMKRSDLPQGFKGAGVPKSGKQGVMRRVKKLPRIDRGKFGGELSGSKKRGTTVTQKYGAKALERVKKLYRKK
tara:strand:+ start:494 stop:781 length:288 start_codon:yes stop_codon:yes gene_type:complete